MRWHHNADKAACCQFASGVPTFLRSVIRAYLGEKGAKGNRLASSVVSIYQFCACGGFALSISMTGMPFSTGYIRPHDGFVQASSSPCRITLVLHFGHTRISSSLSSMVGIKRYLLFRQHIRWLWFDIQAIKCETFDVHFLDYSG